jgi:hypothetical protein
MEKKMKCIIIAVVAVIAVLGVVVALGNNVSAEPIKIVKLEQTLSGFTGAGTDNYYYSYYVSGIIKNLPASYDDMK